MVVYTIQEKHRHHSGLLPRGPPLLFVPVIHIAAGMIVVYRIIQHSVYRRMTYDGMRNDEVAFKKVRV